eukprot:1482732-Pyramimonas_sp.AAC.1
MAFGPPEGVSTKPVPRARSRPDCRDLKQNSTSPLGGGGLEHFIFHLPSSPSGKGYPFARASRIEGGWFSECGSCLSAAHTR